MKKFKKMSFIIKSILITSILMILMGITLTLSSIIIQKNTLTTEMEKQALAIANQWGQGIDPSVVEEAATTTDIHSQIQQELTAYFDNISATNPNVAQGYIQGANLTESNESIIIAIPTTMIEALEEVGMKIGDLYQQPEVIVNAIKELVETKEVTTSDIYEDAFGTWITVLYPLKNSSGEIFAFFGVDVDASMVKNGANTFLTSSLLIIVPSIIIIVLLQAFYLRKSAAPLNDLTNGITEIQQGNFDIHLPTREDDLGQINEAFNKMALHLKTMLGKVQQTSSTVLESSGLLTNITAEFKEKFTNVSNNIDQMTDGIQTQEYAIVESANAMEQISTEIELIANSTQDINMVSNEMEEYSQRGYTSMQQVVQQMDVINAVVKEANHIIITLENRSKEISSILDVITDISDQTNLLALNAAIEAARAGEHGKGFTVVAEEVRKLAEESSQSTKEIAKIIEEIQTETKRAVSSMNMGAEQVDKGTKIAKTTGEIFDTIKQYTSKINEQIDSIASGAQEISAGTEEVTASVKDLKTVAQKNTNLNMEIDQNTKEQLHSVNQLSDAAVELNNLAEELQALISKFNAS